METREDAVLDLLTNLLSVGRNSRLYRSMVYRDQVAQSVIAYQHGMEQAGVTAIVATAQKGSSLSRIEDSIFTEIEKIADEGPTAREFEAALNTAEMGMMEGRISALQKANGLATYLTLTGDPTRFNASLGRFAGISPEELRERARLLLETPRAVLSIVSHGRADVAAAGSEVLDT
jgi:zinc protease